MAHPNEHHDALLKLPIDDRAEAAERLLASLDAADAGHDEDFDRLWATEIERRAANHARTVHIQIDLR